MVKRRPALLVAALVAMMLLAVWVTAMAADQKASLSDVQISAVMPSTATTSITMQDAALTAKHTAITGTATSLGHTSRDAVALFQGYSDATATTTAIHNYAGTQLGEIRGLRA